MKNESLLIFRNQINIFDWSGSKITNPPILLVHHKEIQNAQVKHVPQKGRKKPEDYNKVRLRVNIFEIKYVMHFGDDAVRNQTRKDQNFDQIRNKKQQGEKVGRPAPENALVFEDR